MGREKRRMEERGKRTPPGVSGTSVRLALDRGRERRPLGPSLPGSGPWSDSAWIRPWFVYQYSGLLRTGARPDRRGIISNDVMLEP